MDIIFTPDGPKRVFGYCYHNIDGGVEPHLRALLRNLVAEHNLQGKKIGEVIQALQGDDRYASVGVVEDGHQRRDFVQINKRLRGLKYQFMTQRGALDWPIESILEDAFTPKVFTDAPFESVIEPKGWQPTGNFSNLNKGEEHRLYAKG